MSDVTAAFCSKCGRSVPIHRDAEPMCTSCSHPLFAVDHFGATAEPADPIALDDLDASELCVACLRKAEAGAITRVEEFCPRCWAKVAPALLEESDALLA